MPTVKTVKPAGGGDFSTLAAWATYAAAQATADQWAECYSGGDCGPVTIASWLSTPTSTVYPRIYAHSSARHNGQLSAFPPARGAYSSIPTAGARFQWSIPYVEVDGMVVYKSTIQPAMQANSGGVCYTVKNCVIARTGAVTPSFCFIDNNSSGLGAAGRHVFASNILYVAAAATAGSGAAVLVGDNAGVSIAVCSNNTIITNGKYGNAVSITCLNTDSIVSNNAVFGLNTGLSQLSFVDSADLGSGEHYAIYFRNATEDAASSFYGDTLEVTISGAITGYLASATDPTPSSGSPLIDAGLDMNAAYALPTADAIGNARPFAAWDIGAIEYMAPASGGGPPSRYIIQAEYIF